QRHRGGRVPVAIDPAVTRALREVAQASDATLFMALVAGFQALLYRYTAQRDLCIGTPIAGRGRAELEGLIGVFVNTLVLRARLDGELPFRALLAQVRGQTLAAYAHQDVPFERLVEELRPERTMSHAPIVQVMLALQEDAAPAIQLPGLAVAIDELDRGAAKFDLTVTVTETAAGLTGWLEYDADLFSAGTASRLAEHLGVVLAGAAARPDAPIGDLPVMTAAERARVVDQWNRTDAPYPRDATLHHLFARQAARRPDAVALISDDGELSYRALDERANQLAHVLIARGVAPGALVGLCLPRSPALVIGVLAILKAGAAYVPLDAAYPAERLAFMIADTALALIVTDAASAAALPGGAALCIDREPALAAAPVTAPEVAGAATDRAYVMYTSGSTGRPKGVVIPHRGVVRLVWSTTYLEVDHATVFGLLASTSFDGSTLELWAPLLHGGRLAVFPDGTQSLDDIVRRIERFSVNAMLLTTGLFDQLFNHQPEAFDRVRQLLVGGDVIPPRLARARVERGLPIVNIYGPTENTTVSTAEVVRELGQIGATVPIGPPIQHSTAYVLDDRLQPAPIGVPGELYVGGDGLADGYLARPELTAERFIASPLVPGATLYRTGDRARWLAHGSLEFLGRLDGQVKIRGFRIELGEVEAALAAHPAVLDVAAIAREDRPGDKRLVAYVVPRGEPVTGSELRQWLRSRLPDPLIPSVIVAIAALPLTPNGKLDRRALPVPGGPAAHERSYTPPATPTEQALAALWTDVLRVERIGTEDSFFELGGHSMRALELLKRINRTFDVDLSYKDVYANPTIAAAAARILDQRARAPGRIALEATTTTRFGLTRAQRRIWDAFLAAPHSTASNMAVAVTFPEAVEATALDAALAELAARHEGLRTRFDDTGGEVMQVVEPSARIAVREVDLRALPAAARAERQAQVMAEARTQPFDLRACPLFRCLVFRHADDRTDLGFVVSHVISDGWSLAVLNRELRAVYDARRAGQRSALPPPGRRFADYVDWQARYLAHPDNVARVERYYERTLGDTPLVPAHVPYDFPERYDPDDTETAAFRAVLSEDVAHRLRALVQARSSSLFLAMFTGLNLTMSEVLGRRDIILGIPSANRHLDELLTT
ncbi:MAG TPA: amino acid adenylation domain-containing protein, partial [Kofleriaceae bacterium]